MARRALVAILAAGAAIVVWAAASAGGSAAAPERGAASPPAGSTTASRPSSDQSRITLELPDPGMIEDGRELFLEGCSSCHGLAAQGREGVAPTLRGAGAAAADFYLSTGRMPLSAPGDQPLRAESRYSQPQIDALVAYIGSLGGDAIPDVDPAAGDLAEGRELFTEFCAGCHQAVARGGIAPGGFAPDLSEATPTQVGEAIRVGPYIMPVFSERTISDGEIDSIARYVEWSTGSEIEHPGGLSLGFLGPIPEGLVAWFVALAALLVVARVIGERTTPEPEGAEDGQ